MPEETIQTNQSAESQETAQTNVDLAREMFGLKTEEPKEKAEPVTTQESDQQTEDAEEQQEEKKGITVKYNKEEMFVPEDELPSYVQKGMNYDKVYGKVSEYEKSLDRVAKIAGYKDHADFISNLDALEKEVEERRQNQFNQLRENLLEEMENNGIDRSQAEQYLENHPLLQEAKRAKEEVDLIREQTEKSKQQEEENVKWQALYQTYPDLMKDFEGLGETEIPSWYNQEMDSLVRRGYDPLHAYELAHKEKIIETTRKQTEQKMIKEQMLGKRSQVETIPQTDPEPEVPEALKGAFSLFGLDPKAAKKYVKK